MPGTRAMFVAVAAFPAAVSPGNLPAAERASLGIAAGRCGEIVVCHLGDLLRCRLAVRGWRARRSGCALGSGCGYHPPYAYGNAPGPGLAGLTMVHDHGLRTAQRKPLQRHSRRRSEERANPSARGYGSHGAPRRIRTFAPGSGGECGRSPLPARTRCDAACRGAPGARDPFRDLVSSHGADRPSSVWLGRLQAGSGPNLRLFREFRDAGHAGWWMTRLRRSGSPARPNIWRLVCPERGGGSVGRVSEAVLHGG
jgi:hypothetical protein